MDADLIVHSATIYTMDAGRPRAQALACRGGRLLCVGTDQEAMAFRGPRTRCLDAGGRAVLPGFIDCHLHFTEWALGRRHLDLRATRSPDEILELVRARAAIAPPGSWVLGSGFDPNLWPADRSPHRRLLDAVAGDRPVLLTSKDMHSCWVSSAALAVAGIDAASLDPPGGRIERDAGRREPTGILRERAMDALRRAVPASTVAEAVAAIEEGLPLAWAAGLTGVHEILDTPEALGLRAWQRRRCEDRPGLRVFHCFPLEHLESAVELGIETGLGDEWLRVGGVKLFADGALGSRTAHLLEPYASAKEAGCGVAVLSRAELSEHFDRAHRHRIAVCVHAIGDAANRDVLDAFQAVLVPGSPARPRHRVEHVQLLAPDDVPRFRELRLIASMQPIHAVSDMEMAEQQWGAERCRFAYAWRSLLESGARLCFGSDAPVEVFTVLDGLRAAVTRRRPDGSPGPAGWIAEQRLDVAQAVRAYTVEAAFASGEEQLKGSLAPGKLADAVMLSHDILAQPEKLPEAVVELTVLDGQVVFARPPA